MPVELPCGQCTGCRLERAKQWAIRCYHEASLYDHNCFITLTYDEENLPRDHSLDVSHWQKFMKRLRKSYGEGIRYFHCGEYGETTFRPHYHACLFNLDFDDRVPFRRESGNILDVSPSLSNLWGMGFCTVGEVTFESAAYVARYIMKKQLGEGADDYYQRYAEDGTTYQLQPEYVTMSRGSKKLGTGGIARDWFLKYKDDLVGDQVVIDGRKMRLPRFYDQQFEVSDPELFQQIKRKRVERLAETKKLSENEFGSRRLRVKETVTEAKLSLGKRRDVQ
jgi:hypothetical protein